MKLRRNEWEHLAPSEPGRTRVNHDSGHCSGDSESLLIEHKDDGSLSAHCFRCGARGFIPSPGYYQRPQERVSGHHSELKEHEGFLLPDDISANRAVWPQEALAWLAKAGLAEVDRKLLWSEERATLYLPVEQEGTSAFGSKLVGYVLRRFSPKSYKVLLGNQADFWGLYQGPDKERIVLVEDVLSAWRCSSFMNSLSLMGTEASIGTVNHVLTGRYKEAIVFLDADNPIVRQKARKISRQLSFTSVRLIEVGTDPKNLSSEKLRKLLTS